MIKKQSKPKLKTTDWNVGQPLDFPHAHNGMEGLARDAMNETAHSPFSVKRQKHKKK
jgi:hypothetical protein